MKSKILQAIKSHPARWGLIGVLILALGAAAVTAGPSLFLPKEKTTSSTEDGKPVNLPTVNLSSFKISPLTSDSTGIDTGTEFQVQCEESMDEGTLKALLTVTPKQEFRIKRSSRGDFRIAFDQKLASNKVYQFQVTDQASGQKRSWAFQTKKSFRLVRTLPRNEAAGVPVDTGIELTFSHSNVEGFEQSFEIQPKVEGRFETHGKTLVFVPKKLDFGTVYTVTVKKGLGLEGSQEKLSEDHTFRFQTIMPEGYNSQEQFFSYSDPVYNFTPQAAPVLKVYTQESLIGSEADITLFKYGSSEAFEKDLKKNDQEPAWAISDKGKIRFDTGSLEKTADIKATIVKKENSYWYSTYLLFPEPLAEGQYLAKTTVDGKEYYTQIQVSNTVVYLMVARDRTLGWINDASTGTPIQDAALSGDGLGNSKTGTDGVAELKGKQPPKAGERYYFKVTVPGRPDFIARVATAVYNPYFSYSDSGSVNDYWSYLYLDRGMYLPDDQINIWGMIRRRDDQPLKEKLLLELRRYDYAYTENTSDAIIDSREIALSPSGTFLGSMALAHYNPGSYYVTVRSGDQILTQQYFQVLEYTKPAYKVDLTPEKKVMHAWEKATMGIQASFFEGSPVSGVELNYNYSVNYSPDNKQHSGQITCSEDGSASMPLDATSNTDSWHPQRLNFHMNNTRAEEQEINVYGGITVFPRDTMIEVEGKLEDSQGIVQIKTSRIDLGKIRSQDLWYYSEEEYRGAPVDMPLTARVFEKHWEKREVGEYYDFINKRTEKKYEYYEEQTLIGEYNLNTQEGNCSFTVDTYPYPKSNFFVEVRGTDSRNQSILETEYLYRWGYYNPYEQSGFSLVQEKPDSSYKLDEKPVITVKYNGENLPQDKNYRFLYIRMKNGVQEYEQLTSPTYTFVYGRDHIPNVYVKAVCFDGMNIFDAGMLDLRYDYEEKKLNIEVRTEKESYKPGDTVKLSVQVSDQQNRPQKAEVNLSLVDEAFFALMDQYVDTLGQIYGPSVSSGLVSDYLSYRSIDEDMNPMAEMGEGGDVPVRKDFRDNAFFGTIETGADGKGEVSFKLPDNLTSWRITYQAVTEDLHAGSGKTNLTAKLPFFVDTVFNKVFLAGDEPSLLMRAFGTELRSGDPVNYEVTLTGPRMTAGASEKPQDSGTAAASVGSETFRMSSQGNQPATLSLGSLQEGSYTLKVIAESKGKKDALERSFRVVGSLLETSRLQFYPLTEGMKIEGGKSLTTVTFQNARAGAYYGELQSLFWSWGQRLDQKLSRKIAGDLLKKYFEEDLTWWEEDLDLSQYQTSDGGLALLTYDSSNPELSAKLCSLAGDAVDRNALKAYFYGILNNHDSTPEDVASAYWGLGALGEPVLLDIRDLLRSSSLELREHLVLGAALAELGDFEGAGGVYSSVASGKLKTEGELAYVDAGGSRDQMVDLTALLSVIAMKIDAPEKMKLFNYIRSNSTSELLTNLERLIYVSNSLPGTLMEGSFTYEVGGERKDVQLKGSQQVQLLLTSEKLANLTISNVKGDLTVSSAYVAPASDLLPGNHDLVGLERTYSAKGKDRDDFQRSDFIRVELKPVFNEAAPDGYYEITDVLPAGFRYVSGRPAEGDQETWYPGEVSGQKLVFGYYYSKQYTRKASIIYYARAVSPGTFTADNAAIKHGDSSVAGFTARVLVTVRD